MYLHSLFFFFFLIMKSYYIEQNILYVLDTRRLPFKEVYIPIDSINSGFEAISKMKVRGAPMIGVVAAFSVAAEALNKGVNKEKLIEGIELLKKSRPTARNLFYALDRILPILKLKNWRRKILSEAKEILKEEELSSKKIAEYGYEVLPDKGTVLTHCNTGSLAAPGDGTALGVIIEGVRRGKKLEIYITETRPRFQGAKLTAYELKKREIPFTLITDSSAPFIIKDVDVIIIGADRIALNGDTANKVGSFSLSLGAKYFGKPLYIAAPTSTIDHQIKTGDHIKIEERDKEEVLKINGRWLTFKDINVKNIAFDIIPGSFIQGIITEYGVISRPYTKNIKRVLDAILPDKP